MMFRKVEWNLCLESDRGVACGNQTENDHRLCVCAPIAFLSLFYIFKIIKLVDYDSGYFEPTSFNSTIVFLIFFLFFLTYVSDQFYEPTNRLDNANETYKIRFSHIIYVSNNLFQTYTKTNQDVL